LTADAAALEVRLPGGRAGRAELFWAAALGYAAGNVQDARTWAERGAGAAPPEVLRSDALHKRVACCSIGFCSRVAERSWNKVLAAISLAFTIAAASSLLTGLQG